MFSPLARNMVKKCLKIGYCALSEVKVELYIFARNLYNNGVIMSLLLKEQRKELQSVKMTHVTFIDYAF